ncbi:aminoacyl-histidine dipeptidase [Flavicella marina]|uniref:aminoacyl-histidine dipeptidase n=1 Tax=Flavicella marina TaxID=1475951 RepID=UPI0012644AEC|nr:aminoacyl-histidine dipeptidase [Flavicella marina]
MHSEIRNLEPKTLWNHFCNINAIPRASKKEEKIVAFMVAFGKKLKLETTTDAVQNVIIRKPATKGLENCKTVVLQSHLDMVHQKNETTVFDFATQGIEMEVNDGWVQAKGTTLGADNGIGVAAIMSILSSTDIPHPPIEALFTIDEETGMTGAMELQPNTLTGAILLNLDTEDDDEISIGCAGGVDVTAASTFKEVLPVSNSTGIHITVKGLQGGHSGMDIHKGLGNANKILNRILLHLNQNIDFQIEKISGGNLRNAIPRESETTLAIPNSTLSLFAKEFSKIQTEIKTEFAVNEADLKLNFFEVSTPKKVIDKKDQSNLLHSIAALHNGVFSMNAKITDLVETSNNLARVTVEDSCIEIACLTRSFSESGKKNLVNSLTSVFKLAGYQTKVSGDYPGWAPNPNTAICKILNNIYQDLFQDTPNIMACHAGLECGILGTHYPDMEMISFGPTIRGAHSPDEKVNIQSTQKFWKYFLEILKNIPEN